MTRHPVIWALFYLCISVVDARYYGYGWNDDYYVRTVITTTYDVYPQDQMDAQFIIDNGTEDKAVASVLPYRDKIRRIAIIRQVAHKSGTEYVSDTYNPRQKDSKPFKDLVYAMSKDENIAIGGFLEYYFYEKDETWIIKGMVLCRDIMQMISTYDLYHSSDSFKDLRKNQRCPFENMLRVWVRQNREASEGEPDPTHLSQDVATLKSECDDGCWGEHRDQIENILMKKSAKYARAVIDEFEKQMNKKLEDIVLGCMNSNELHDIGDAYAALAKYLKNRHQYISDELFNNHEGANKWTVWSMCIAVTESEEWSKINEIFQKDHGQSLTQFIMDKMSDDKVMAEMIAVVVDPAFKPTTFVKRELEPGAGPCY